MTAAEPKPQEWRNREWPTGWTVEHVAATGSTNADLLAGADVRPDRTVLVADYQDAGRGRLDRAWASPPGTNLLASLLFHDVPDEPTDLPRRVSVAAVDACRGFTSGDVTLKWPNDVLLDGRKVAGVLAQRGPTGPVVVGIGINVGWCIDSAARLGDGVDRAELLAALLSAYDVLPAVSRKLYERYRAELATLGMRVRVELPAGEVIGTATDLMLDGRLVVVDVGGATHRFDAGDVVHLRPAD
jgi:BirA family biotin operon repressor/biotin-[acetyl-CoA-carboxylase] ligase